MEAILLDNERDVSAGIVIVNGHVCVPDIFDDEWGDHNGNVSLRNSSSS